MVVNSAGFLDTQRIIAELGVGEGMHIGDFGAGSGFFTVDAAQKVGPQGRVYAVDVQTGPLEAVASRAAALELENINTVRADLEVPGGTNIPAEGLDIVLLANVLFQSQKKEAIVQEAHRTLKQGGTLLVIDWKKGAGGAVPDDMRTSVEDMKALVQAQGFRAERDIDAGPFYFGIVFHK